MQTSTDGVTTAVAEEPPSKNVRVARRGVAAGLLSLVIYLILATYTAMSGWAHNEQVAFGRSALTLGMVAGLGVALFGYGVERSARNSAASNVELLDRFRGVLAEVEVDRIRRERAREPIVAAQVADVVNEDVRPLVVAMHDGLALKVQQVAGGMAELLEELRKIRARQALADEALVAAEVKIRDLETLGNRMAELEKDLSMALGGNVVDLEMRRAFNRVDRHFHEGD